MKRVYRSPEKMTKKELIDLLMSKDDVFMPRIRHEHVTSHKEALLQSRDVMSYLEEFKDSRQESFYVISLSSDNCVLMVDEISRGSLQKTVVHPRDVFYAAIKANAVSIIIAHNHPNGLVTPSREDVELTKNIRDAGNIMYIPLIDHIIFNNELDFYSFLEHDFSFS